MNQLIYTGMPASELGAVTWRKSTRSNSQGNCVEMAELPDGRVAIRNSRDAQGPALVCTRSQLATLIGHAREDGLHH